MKQVKYIDLGEDVIHGGILLDDGKHIICACCGSLFEKNDPYIKILEVYKDWVDFSETLIME